MGESSRFEAEKLISYSDVLVELLRQDNDVINFKQCLHQSKGFQSRCDADVIRSQTSLEEYQKKIDMCKQRIAEAKSEVAADADMDLLQKELEEEIQRERLLRDELRVISNEIENLECQRDSVEERWETLKKLEQDEPRAQMKLSMYASVTSIIPNLADQSKISGHIVEKDKKVVEKFEFDSAKVTAFDTCNSIWKMINS